MATMMFTTSKSSLLAGESLLSSKTTTTHHVSAGGSSAHPHTHTTLLLSRIVVESVAVLILMRTPIATLRRHTNPLLNLVLQLFDKALVGFPMAEEASV